MNLKCVGTNVSEIASGNTKVPQWTATLEPVGGGPSIRITGPAGSLPTTMTYGKTYSVTEVQ